jgi:hypothetical protein
MSSNLQQQLNTRSSKQEATSSLQYSKQHDPI